MAEVPTFWEYLRSWFHAVRKGAWDMFGTLTTLAGVGLWAWRRWWPTSFAKVAELVRVTPESAMSDWVWQVPIAVGVMALAYRCVRAPYEIHIATIAAQNTAETELAKLRGQNYGIEVVCSNLVLTWESIPEMPPGVLIALDVAQIVNANTYDAALRVKLMVPLWRLRRDHGADLTVSVSSRPLMSTPSIVKSKLPQLPPVINIRAKHAVGPGLFLFFLSSGSIKAYDFAPVDTKDMSLDDVARLVGEAEMYIEVTDVANRVVLPPVLLPGTDEKRRKRLRSQ